MTETIDEKTTEDNLKETIEDNHTDKIEDKLKEIINGMKKQLHKNKDQNRFRRKRTVIVPNTKIKNNK